MAFPALWQWDRWSSAGRLPISYKCPNCNIFATTLRKRFLRTSKKIVLKQTFFFTISPVPSAKLQYRCAVKQIFRQQMALRLFLCSVWLRAVQNSCQADSALSLIARVRYRYCTYEGSQISEVSIVWTFIKYWVTKFWCMVPIRISGSFPVVSNQSSFTVHCPKNNLNLGINRTNHDWICMFIHKCLTHCFWRISNALYNYYSVCQHSQRLRWHMLNYFTLKKNLR